ncbi:unnamed protein product, partial [Rotaria magnacalcarata]
GVTAFLSMWISNTAAVSIMLPVSLAIIGEVQQQVTDLADKNQANKEATTAANGMANSKIFYKDHLFLICRSN